MTYSFLPKRIFVSVATPPEVIKEHKQKFPGKHIFYRETHSKLFRIKHEDCMIPEFVDVLLDKCLHKKGDIFFFHKKDMEDLGMEFYYMNIDNFFFSEPEEKFYN